MNIPHIKRSIVKCGECSSPSPASVQSNYNAKNVEKIRFINCNAKRSAHLHNNKIGMRRDNDTIKYCRLFIKATSIHHVL